MAKVRVSLPDELLTQVDADARRRGMSRSRWLCEAVKRQLPRRRATAEEMRAAIERMEARFAKHAWPTDEDLAADKAERDKRR